MISFESDYNNGAHPKVLQHLIETNDQTSLAYGFDEWSERAKEKIKAVCETPDAQVFLLGGGTQTNTVVIDAMLRSYQAVVCAESGHINVHESGAIERSGHAVIALSSHHGKLSAADLSNYMTSFLDDPSKDHVAQPGMVYISFPTEYGTIYQAKEIADLYDVCQTHHLHLFIDGARLGYGLASPESDITLPWLARHCDAFYIGGTKVGALCGEAVVFTHNNAPAHFLSIIKQHGALFAKGRLLGIQFDALFTDNLYFDISRHAIDMAMKMKRIFEQKGYPFYIDSPTNQQFIILPNDEMKRLAADLLFTIWCKHDNDHTVCRFVTSWATTQAELDVLSKCVLNS